MFRTLNAEKVKLLKANKREVVSTILFLVLLFAAVLFIAFAGHI
jgi:ABC-type microcin C transport system permease subunit YejE